MMLGSTMIFQKTTKVDLIYKKCASKATNPFQTNLSEAVQACLQQNMSLLTANNVSKISSMMKTLSGLNNIFN
jgi:hypothetical protein